MRSAKEFSLAIVESIQLADFITTALICDELVTSLFQSKDNFPSLEAERIMTKLRGAMLFSLMQKVGNAFVITGRGSFTIHRQFAQAAIEQKQFDLAIFILNDLIQRTSVSEDKKAVSENAEAKGLLGRIYKQLFVTAFNEGTKMAKDYLEKAFGCYYQVYQVNDEEYLWQGVNALALICRAKKENLDIKDPPDYKLLAEKIKNIVAEKEVAEKALAWDFAIAAEACIALDQWHEALEWTEKYVQHSDISFFAISGTLRQFREIWQLDKVPEAAQILFLLNQSLAIKTQVENQSTTKTALKKTDDYESNFGDDTIKTLEWYQEGLARCNAVARIGVEASKGIGTGFLLRGSVLTKKLGDDFVLLTNEHVINDDPEIKDTLRCEDAKVIFEKVGMKEIFGVEKTYSVSDRSKLDVAIVQFFQKDQQRINEIGQASEPFPVAKALPIVEKTQRIYIIGHPGGETLSLSLQDNELLDHEAPAPRIHYRTPTEKGSSGSPVFNRIWKLIGIHHKGGEMMPRLNNLQGTYKANEGIWIQSIINDLQTQGK